MRSPCAGAALDPPLWIIVPNKVIIRVSPALSDNADMARSVDGELKLWVGKQESAWCCGVHALSLAQAGEMCICVVHSKVHEVTVS